MYATKNALERASAAMTAATLAAGLLTTSTYQAIYTPFVSSADRTELLGRADQTGNPIVSAAQADYAFRLLNALSFAFSLLCIAFATFVLWEIAVKNTYRPLLFRGAFVGLLTALLTSIGAALCSVFVFVDRTAGIVGATFVCIIILALFVGFCGCITVDPRQGKPPILEAASTGNAAVSGAAETVSGDKSGAANTVSGAKSGAQVIELADIF